MMSNEMISVPRELLSRIAGLVPDYTCAQLDADEAELRALLAKPAEQSQGNAVAARVCAYTPGMGQVELKLPGNLPSWLELGETVTVLHGDAQPQGEPVGWYKPHWNGKSAEWRLGAELTDAVFPEMWEPLYSRPVNSMEGFK